MKLLSELASYGGLMGLCILIMFVSYANLRRWTHHRGRFLICWLSMMLASITLMIATGRFIVWLVNN